jgi:hypothetical protein
MDNITLPEGKPDYAYICKLDAGEIELNFIASDTKTIYKLRAYDKRRAVLERVQLCDFDAVKNRFNTMMPAQFRDIIGLANVRRAFELFASRAHTITLDAHNSCWHTDRYYV